MKNVEKEKLIGVFEANERGFGFVRLEIEESDDVFIARNDINGALNGDVVEVEIISEKSENKRPEGKVIRIVRRGKTTLVGTFKKQQNFGFVIPDDKKFDSDIFIPKKHFGKARDNHKVVVKILKYPEKGKNAEGEIIEVIGGINQAGVDMMSLIKEYDLPSKFPDDVIKEAKSFGDKIDKSEIKNRVDLRDRTIFTIDGEDAKDLDDAIMIEKLANGNYLLDVHIADVSHYVKDRSKLDREARIRGTSVYMLR